MGETPSIPLELLPLGFRFHPTDEELINHYLKRKIDGRIRPADAAVIPEIDVCRFEPWDLPGRSAIRSDDPEWFFFAPVDRKYPSGNRSNRATGVGYWKATGRDRFIRSRVRGGPAVVVGMKKTLVFHQGRAPKGVRTNWIMHEYRTVEPEFEPAGDKGGFVLCRLFRKPEETVSGTNSYEQEESDCSPTPTRSSPGSTLGRNIGLEEEFATPLNKESPDSILRREVPPLPDTTRNMTSDTGDHGADESRHIIPYPVKPEECHCNSNMTSDTGDHGTEIAGEEGAPLFDDLAQFLGPEYEHLLSDEFSQIKSPMLPISDYAICCDVAQGSHTQTQYPLFEQDSVTEMLDAMLSTPEECSADVSNDQIDSSANVVSPGKILMINQGSDWNSVMDKEIGHDVDSEALMAQGGLGVEASAQSRLPLSPCRSLQMGSLQMGTSDLYNENHPSIEVRCKRKSTGKLEPIETRTLPVPYTKFDENLTGPANSVGTNVDIRLRARSRSRLCTSIADKSNSPGQQGLAERRIRLQSSEHAEQEYIYMMQVVSMGTVESDDHADNQIAEETEASEPAFGEHEQLSPGDGDEEPALRLRTRQNNDADVKQESSSFHQQPPRVCLPSIRRIGVSVLVIASLLCAGTIWFLSS